MLQYRDSLRRSGVATAWLTLDQLDDDFRRLLMHLVAAFDLILNDQNMPNRSEELDSSLCTFNPFNLDSLALDLMDRIANCSRRFTLFIDDFETVSNRSVDDLLRLILNRMPGGAQLAIASRKTPELALGRLRAQGELVEIDEFRLRFSRDEASTFLLKSSGLSLTAEAVTRLHCATEGWPAALRLAAIAMENRAHPDSFIASFTGSNAAVVDYLAEEVLFLQPENVQEFLLKTSVLSELNPSLCNAVCGRQDSELVLRNLEHSNACVTPLDSERRLYRYHGLFADFLRDQLRRHYPDEIPGLQLRAARWYAVAGRWVPEIEHALESGHPAYAVSLIEAHANTLLFQGRFGLLARWLDKLSQESFQSRPHLRIAHIWALTFTRRSTQGLRILKAFESDNIGAAMTADLHDELQCLHPYLLMILDQQVEGLSIANEAVLNHSKPDRFSYNIFATTLASWKLAANKYSEALALLNYTAQEGGAESRLFPRVYAVRLEGCIALAQCQLRQATAHFRFALAQAVEARYGSRSTAVYLAESLYEIDDLKEAEQLLALYLPTTLEYMQPDVTIISHILRARIALDREDVDHAHRCLGELEYFGRSNKLPRLLAAAHLEWARIALLRDDVSRAQIHYDLASNPAAWNGQRGLVMPANDVESLALCRYRLAVYGIDTELSIVALRAEIKMANAGLRYRRALKLNVLLAKLFHVAGQQRLALRTLCDCVRTAAREGMIRVFLDEGTPVLSLLQELHQVRTADLSTEHDHEMKVFICRVLDRAGLNADCDPVESRIDHAAEKLTTRELQILESLCQGSPDVAIAQSLFVATATVRTHLRRVYAKLGVSNRIQAVSKGRSLGLIK